MKLTFKKNVLAVAVAAAAMVSGSAMAAQANYIGSRQVTFAKDLFATDSRTVDLPAGFTVYADNPTEAASLAAIVAGNTIEIVVSLGAGSNAGRFQSSYANMSRANIGANTWIGNQLQNSGAPVRLNTLAGWDVSYSQGERELRIRFNSTGGALRNPNPAAANNDYSVRLPALRVYDLEGALLTGSVLAGGISISNATVPRAIVAENAVFAHSAWGERVRADLTGVASRWIDVQRCNNNAPSRVWFSGSASAAAGSVGTSCSISAFARSRFNVGKIDVRIESDNEIGFAPAAAESRIADFRADLNARWGLISSHITYTVKGTNLQPWNGSTGNPRMWLDVNSDCRREVGGGNQFADLTVNAAGTEASYTHQMGVGPLSGHFNPLTNTTNWVSMHVCFGANGTTTLVPQQLSAEVSFDHRVPALFVNPDPFQGSLFPLRDNVGILLFQNVNPGGNSTAQSFLRLTNHNAVDCVVRIDAKDDAGRHSGEVTYTMAPHSSEQFNIDVLETGVDTRTPARAISGKFGKGTGKWYVRVQPECARFDGSALNRNSTNGTVTDLTEQVNRNWETPTVKIPQ